MADGVDVYLQGLRDVRTGVRGLGDDIVTAKQISAQKESEEAKRRQAEEVANVRLGLKEDVDGIMQSFADDPDYSREQFALDVQPIVEKSIQIGDTSALKSLDDIRESFAAREKLEVADRQNESDKTKADRLQRTENKKTELETKKILLGIKKDYDDTFKTVKESRQAYGQISSVVDKENRTGADDARLVYNYMRMLDPGSVVREKEFQTAADLKSFFTKGEIEEGEDGNWVTKNGITVPTFVIQAFQKADPEKRGSFLLQQQVDDMGSSAEDAFRARLEDSRSDEQTINSQIDAFSDPSNRDRNRKMVFTRTIDEDLQDIDKRKKSREEKKKAREKAAANAEANPATADAPPKKQVSMSTYERDIRPKLTPEFMRRVEAINAQRAASGGAPLSDGEKRAIEAELVSRGGWIIVPDAQQ